MIKCLKKLCTFFVIGLPILFVNFSNADYFYLNDPATIYDGIGTNVFTLKNYANFDTEGVKVLQIQGRGNYPRLHTLFWNGSGLYHIVSCAGGYECQNIHTSIKEQGFYTRYCETTYDNTCTNLDTDISNFLNDDTLSNPDRLYVKNLSSTDDLQYFTMCFQYSGLNKSICFYSDNSTEVLYNSLGLTNNPYISDMDSIFLSLITDSLFSNISVFDPNSTIPDYDFNEDDDYTNGEIIAGFEAMGISEGYCYGGFASDNIFNIGDIPENFTGYRWGSGVNILDIYDSYSGAYETPKLFLRNFYQAYLSDNYNSFYGTTKSLYGFFDQIEKTDISQVGFNSFMAMITPTNVYEYCYLKFKSDPNAKYDGDNRNAKFAFYSSGTVNLGGRFDFSGNNSLFSGAVSGFNNISGFFANMNAIFQGNLGSISHKKAIIPSYILVFMLAIILVRILKH